MNQTPGNGAGLDPHADPPGAVAHDAASAETTEPEGAGAADTIADQAARIAGLEDARLRALADLENMRKR